MTYHKFHHFPHHLLQPTFYAKDFSFALYTLCRTHVIHVCLLTFRAAESIVESRLETFIDADRVHEETPSLEEDLQLHDTHLNGK